MKTVEEIIQEIPVNISNLGHIAAKGKINGSLLQELKKSHKAYAKQAVEELVNRSFYQKGTLKEIAEQVIKELNGS